MTSSITPEQARERVARAICNARLPSRDACCKSCRCTEITRQHADAALAAIGLTWADAAALMAGKGGPRPFSDQLAGKVISTQVATIKRLETKLAAHEKEKENGNGD